MFLAFKGNGVADPYYYGDEEVPAPLDPVDNKTARCIRLPSLFEAGKIFPWLFSALRLFTSLEHFEDLFIVQKVQIKVNWAMRSADMYDSHLRSLAHQDCGLITKQKGGNLKFLSKFFTVSKKGKPFSRAIFNGRNLSRLQRPPPPVNLPEIPEVLREAARIHAFWQQKSNTVISPSVHESDIRHYFHEFNIDSEIALYFGVSCSGQEYAWQGLPMGWAHSPRIAQCVSWSLILNDAPSCLDVEVEKAKNSAHPPAYALSRNSFGDVTGIVFIWYDNFVIIGYDNDNFRQIVANLNRQRMACGIQWSSEVSFSPQMCKAPVSESKEHPNQYPEFLGIRLRVLVERRPREGNPRSHLAWQTEGKFRVKCAETAILLKSGSRSRRTIARGVGLIIWQTYVYGIPLVYRSDVMGIATANAPKKPGRSVWDHDSDISQEQITALCTNLEDIAADIFWNVHRDEALDTENTVRVVSDASGSKGAFMSFDEFDRTAKQDYWSFSEEFMTTSIFLKELMAADNAADP